MRQRQKNSNCILHHVVQLIGLQFCAIRSLDKQKGTKIITFNDNCFAYSFSFDFHDSYAYIEFADKEAAEKALELDESMFKSRQLKVMPKRQNAPVMRGGRGGRGRGGRFGPVYGGRSTMRAGGRGYGRGPPAFRGGGRGRGGGRFFRGGGRGGRAFPGAYPNPYY